MSEPPNLAGSGDRYTPSGATLAAKVLICGSPATPAGNCTLQTLSAPSSISPTPTMLGTSAAWAAVRAALVKSISSAPNMMTRRVRFSGWAAAAWAAPTAMAIPAPSSIEPVPGSQESRWPPITIICSGCSVPGMSPITVQPVAGAIEDESFNRMRTGAPLAASRSSHCASITDRAAAGIFGASAA